MLAVDRDGQAVQASAALTEALQADLEGEAWPAALDSFDVVMCCNYLFRPRLDLLAALVAPGGLFLYETFARGNEAFGRPANPDFLLRPGELIEVADRARLVVLAYEHGYVERPKAAMVQRLCAVRPPYDAQHLCLDASRVG